MADQSFLWGGVWETLQPWLVGGSASAAAGLWVVYKFVAEHRSNRERDARQSAADERRQLSADVEATIIRKNADIKILTEDSDRLEVKLRALEKDRDRGWDLARLWRLRALRTAENAEATIAIANMRLSTHDLPTVPNPPTEVPGLEDI